MRNQQQPSTELAGSEMYKFDSGNPRSLKSFGLAGLLNRDCQVFYDSIFSPRNVGRVSDLLVARLGEKVDDDLRFRTLLLFTLFQAYRSAMGKGASWDLASKGACAEPIVIECGFDKDKVAVGVSFQIPEGDPFDLIAVNKRAQEGEAPINSFERLLDEVRGLSDQIVLKAQPSIGRYEIVSLLSITKPEETQGKAPFELVFFTAPPEVPPNAAAYVAMGDLDYHGLLASDDPATKDRQDEAESAGKRIKDLTEKKAEAEPVVVSPKADDDTPEKIVKDSKDMDSELFLVKDTTHKKDPELVLVKDSTKKEEREEFRISDVTNRFQKSDQVIVVSGRGVSFDANDEELVVSKEKEDGAGTLFRVSSKDKPKDSDESMLLRIPMDFMPLNEVVSALPEGKNLLYLAQIEALQKKIVELEAKNANIPRQHSQSVHETFHQIMERERKDKSSTGISHNIEKMLKRGDLNNAIVELTKEAHNIAKNTSSERATKWAEQAEKLLVNEMDWVQVEMQRLEDLLAAKEEKFEKRESELIEAEKTIEEELKQLNIDHKEFESADKEGNEKKKSVTARDSEIFVSKMRGFDDVLNRANQEIHELVKETKSDRAKRLADGLIQEIITEKSRLSDLARSLDHAIRKNEHESAFKVRGYKEELKRRDLLLKQKETILMQTKIQLQQVQMKLDELKKHKIVRTYTGDTELQKKLDSTQSQLKTSKDENVVMQKKIEELKRDNAQVQANMNAQKIQVTSSQELLASKMKLDMSNKQLDEFKRQNRQLMDRLVRAENKRAASNVSQVDELKMKLDQAMKAMLTKKKEVESYRLKLTHAEEKEANLKKELLKVQNELRAAKVGASAA